MKNNIILLRLCLVLLAPCVVQAVSSTPVDMLIGPYLKIQQGLSKDDLAEAQTGAMEMMVMIKHGQWETVDNAQATELADSAKSIAGASGIGDARKEFQDLSVQVTKLIERFGTSGERQLYLAKCPMAFGGKGATWIQRDESIANPYFGSKMFACGSIQEQIAGNEDAK